MFPPASRPQHRLLFPRGDTCGPRPLHVRKGEIEHSLGLKDWESAKVVIPDMTKAAHALLTKPGGIGIQRESPLPHRSRRSRQGEVGHLESRTGYSGMVRSPDPSPQTYHARHYPRSRTRNCGCHSSSATHRHRSKGYQCQGLPCGCTGRNRVTTACDDA